MAGAPQIVTKVDLFRTASGGVNGVKLELDIGALLIELPELPGELVKAMVASMVANVSRGVINEVVSMQELAGRLAKIHDGLPEHGRANFVAGAAQGIRDTLREAGAMVAEVDEDARH